MTRARARRIARGEEEEYDSADDHNDDDVFSTFGDDNENNHAEIPSPQIELKDAAITPLQEFFQHVTATTTTTAIDAAATEKTLTYIEWKAHREQLLTEYLNHRLGSGNHYYKEEKDEADDGMDEESFQSEIMDEPFKGGIENIDSSAITENHQPEEEEDDDDEEENDEDEEPLQTQQQLETQDGILSGFKSGIKRKLAFLSPSQDTNDGTNNNKKKRHKTIMMARKTPGQMWDGNFASVPQFTELEDFHEDGNEGEGNCCHLSEMDLTSSSVNLGLCRVVKVWGLRSTDRMDLHKQKMMVLDNNSGGFGSWEDDGPFSTIYEKVFSVEVVQLDTNSTSSSNSAVCNLAATIPKNEARKRRHTVRRVRIFFYNRYAQLMDAIFGRFDHFNKRKTPVLLSLVDVPPECIAPVSLSAGSKRPLLQQYVNNPFGDDKLGVSSPYCICIGDKSTAKVKLQDGKDGNKVGKIRLDGGKREVDMEIHLVEVPVEAQFGNSSADDIAGGIGVNDIMINATSIRSGEGYNLKGESTLIKQYLKTLTEQKEEGETEYRKSVFNAEEYEKAASESRHDVQNAGAADLGGTKGNTANSAVGDENTDPNAHNSEVIVRPETVASLSSLRTLLNKGKRDPVIVYGVVLGFSAPRITRSDSWMMSIVLIDETIPISREAGAENKKELHVPSITLNLFAKNKANLPQVRSAGDVICCHKVLLQQYNNEPQLLARRNSNIIVIRPREARSPGGSLQNPVSSDDWSVSEKRNLVGLDLVNELWRWGQMRLSTHPTMSPSCYLAISQVNDHVGNTEVLVSGDITAIVTSILPTPKHLRENDTPRGFLRLWDGTGPSRSDTMPINVENTNAGQSIADPPEQVLVKIEKILKAFSSAEVPDSTCAGVNAPIALCGRVINAIIWEEDLWDLIEKGIVKVGSFIRLRNINKRMLPTDYNGTESHVNCLSVHAKSSMTPLPYDAYEVKLLLKGHDTRLKRGVPTNPTSAILPSTSATTRPTFTARESAISGISMLEECLGKPAPATFTVQFEVSRTIPASDLNSVDTLKAFCVERKDGAVFRFAMHIKDSSAEVDVICHGKEAEEILGISAQEVSSSAMTCNQALDTLKDYMSPGSVYEGKIRSVLGKDKRIYFVLCSMFCLTS